MTDAVIRDDLGPEFLIGPPEDPTHLRISDPDVLGRVVAATLLGSNLTIDVSGVSDTVDLSSLGGGGPETVTTLVDDGDGTATYTDEVGGTSSIDPWVGTRQLANDTTVIEVTGPSPFDPNFVGRTRLVNQTSVPTAFSYFFTGRNTVTGQLGVVLGVVDATDGDNIGFDGRLTTTEATLNESVRITIGGDILRRSEDHRANSTEVYSIESLFDTGHFAPGFGPVETIRQIDATKRGVTHTAHSDTGYTAMTLVAQTDGKLSGNFHADDGATSGTVGLTPGVGLGGTTAVQEATFTVTDANGTRGLGVDDIGLKAMTNAGTAGGPNRPLVSAPDGFHLEWSPDAVVTALNVDTTNPGSEQLQLISNGTIVNTLPLVAVAGGGWAFA